MGNIISFKGKYQGIEFDDFIGTSTYLQLTSINALNALGYSVTVEGVKEFQHNNKLEEDGIIKLEELGILMQVFNPEQFQEIVDQIETHQKEYKKILNARERKEVPTWKIIVTLAAMTIFMLWGVIDFWRLIFSLFTK